MRDLGTRLWSDTIALSYRLFKPGMMVVGMNDYVIVEEICSDDVCFPRL